MPAYTTLRSTHIEAGYDPKSFRELGKKLGPYEAARQFQEQEKTRTAQVEARSKIKPIADPDEEQAERRKRSARRRRGGRLGTILTRDTLG